MGRNLDFDELNLFLSPMWSTGQHWHVIRLWASKIQSYISTRSTHDLHECSSPVPVYVQPVPSISWLREVHTENWASQQKRQAGYTKVEVLIAEARLGYSWRRAEQSDEVMKNISHTWRFVCSRNYSKRLNVSTTLITSSAIFSSFYTWRIGNWRA